MAPYRHLPKLIQEAVLRVETHPSFSVLTRSQKKVLKSLVSRASKVDGLEPIKARLDIVADTTGVHYKTVQRALQVFRTLGWLSDMMGGRSVYGVFTSGKYQFSISLCSLVGLRVKEDWSVKAPQETEMSSGAVYVDLTFKEDQRKDSAQKRSESPTPVTLPAELEEITKVGVKDTGVAKLRGLAHQAGHRLEHIWRVCKPRIEALGAKGGRVYRYLEKMIATPSDYAARAQKAALCESIALEVSQGVAKARYYANRRYAGKGCKLRIFECGTRAEVDMGNGRYHDILPRDIEQIYRAIEKGELQELIV